MSNVTRLEDHPFVNSRMHQKIRRGLVWCPECDSVMPIDPLAVVINGMPECCGVPMTIESPKERGIAV